MIPQKLALVVSLYVYALSVDAFSLARTSSPSMPAVSAPHRFTSTCLHADGTASEEGGAPDGESQQPPPQEEEGNQEETQESGGNGGTDILNSPAFLTRKIDVLKSDIAKVEEDLQNIQQVVEAGKAEWRAQFDDLENEYKNIQERMTKQNKAGDTDAIVKVVRKMLDVLDTFDRGFGVVQAETDSEKAIEAEYRKCCDQIHATFESLGVKEVETVGTEFDYEVHQAVMQRPSEYEEGIVCEELAKGYVIGDTLIRAAMVSVSA